MALYNGIFPFYWWPTRDEPVWDGIFPLGNGEASPAEGEMKIIWVATDGNDTTGTGSQQQPYLTIERAFLDFDSGDQIRLCDGTYTPRDTIVFRGKSGSLFSETPMGATIQPQSTSRYNTGVAIINSPRFTVQGVRFAQSSDTRHTIGLYINNVSRFIAFTCHIDNFTVTSGTAYGIFARGNGRIEGCHVENFTVSNDVYGIKSEGLDVIECHIEAISGSTVWGIHKSLDFV